MSTLQRAICSLTGVLLVTSGLFTPTVLAQCVVPDDHMAIRQDTTLCSGVHHLPQGIYIPGVPNITVDGNGATLRGTDQPNSSGIYVSGSGADNVLIRNLTLQDYDFGIFVLACQNVRVENVTILDCRTAGVKAQNATALRVSNCTIRNIPAGNGIFLGGSANSQITNNSMSRCGVRALAVLQSPSVSITGNIITENTHEGIYNDSMSVVVNHNDIYANGCLNVHSSPSTSMDARRNWWGTTSCALINSELKGDVAFDPILNNSFSGGSEIPCSNDPIVGHPKHPIIIIPGIFGTELVEASNPNKVVWFDPLQLILPGPDSWLLGLSLQSDGKTVDSQAGGKQVSPGNLVNINGGGICLRPYAELISFLSRPENGSYILGNDLYLFGYDWRLAIDSPAEALHEVIASKWGSDPGAKVNIIAHSMGGLVLRAFMNKYQDPRDNHICTVIYLGTPHFGSVKAYAVLAGYATALDWVGGVFCHLNVATSITVSRNFPSVYALLPQFDFFHGESVAQSLSRLNSTANSQLLASANDFHSRLENINFAPRSYQISGSGQLTLRRFKGTAMGCTQAELGNGDGTVPVDGSDGFAETRYFYVYGAHGCLPALPAVQTKIGQILNGSESAVVDVDGDAIPDIRDAPFGVICTTQSSESCTKQWKSCSPIRTLITDARGNATGIDDDGNVHDEITNSDYIAFEHNESGFMPADEEYMIAIRATDTGSFSLSFEDTDGLGSVVNVVEYQDIPVTKETRGQVMLVPNDPAPILSLDIDGDGAEDAAVMPGPAPPELIGQFYERGDVSKDRTVDISDAIAILNYLFLNGTLACADAANTNGDSETDISDAVYVLLYLFSGQGMGPAGHVYCP